MSLLDLAREATEHRAMQKVTELAAFGAIVIENPPRRVLEIGTYAGGTLWFISRVASYDATLVSLDVDHTHLLVPEPDGPNQRVVTLVADSRAPETRARVEGELAGEELDLLFIDGEHTYEAVRSDWEAWRGLVTPGGLVAFHDIRDVPPSPEVGVPRLWAEVRSEGHPAVEIIDNDGDQWAGIGVLRVAT